MAEPARKFEQPHDRAAQLHALGLKEAEVNEMVVRGYVERQTCTPFHPASYPGTSQWAETVAASRELLTPRGWTPKSSNNYDLVISPDEKIAIAISTGDKNTGRVNSQYGEVEPRTKHPKGTETRLAVLANEPVTLFEGVLPEQSLVVPRSRQDTWILLFATGEHEIRYELSRPKAQDAEGRVVAWSERIVFPPIEIDSLPTRADNHDDDDDGTAGIDVPVERI
jgi:hypothetical protein